MTLPHFAIGDYSGTLWNGDQNNENFKTDAIHVVHAMDLLLSLGVPTENLCTSHHQMIHLLPMCIKDVSTTNKTADKPAFDWNSIVRSRRKRYLREIDDDFEDGAGDEDFWFLLTHALCALACVTTAALAAGLTMGLLSLDPLLLLIRMRAGSTQEKEQAATLLPIVKQHHLLLVTLLLLNSIANEALPLFLVRFCPP